MKRKFVVLIDCGHSLKTPGKRSPDERFREYLYNRIIGKLLAARLEELGIPYHFVLNLETEEDTPLAKRVETANAYARGYGKDNVLFISIHYNAMGKGEWYDNATGWSIYTSKGKTKSDEYATIFWNKAKEILPIKVRKDMSDGDVDKEENFYVLHKTICPAVLVEQGFYTSHKEVEYLMSEQGLEDMTNVLVEGIKEIAARFNEEQ